MGTFNETAFEQKLLYLKDTHDSIASLSNWCLSNQEHHGKIVSTWLNVLKRVKIEHRLLLFYLANDVIQYSRRKSLPFVDAFAPALQKATTMVREESVRQKILRLFKIWDERGIYDEGFLVDLSGLLSHGHKGSRIDVADFQPSILYSRIRSCKQLEDTTDLKLQKINEANFNLTNLSELRNSLKHRAHGEDVTVEFEQNLTKIKEYINALEAEIKDRNGLIDLLEIGEQYYDKEFHEAKVVVNAYKCFASRVRGVKRKLEEKLETMPSPIPSPDINAPSPSPEPKDSSSSVSPDTTFIQDRHEQSSSSLSNTVSHIEPIPNVYIPPKPFNFYSESSQTITNNDTSYSHSSAPVPAQVESFMPDNVSSASFLNDPSFLKSSITTDFLNEFRSSNNIFEEGRKAEENMPPFLSSDPVSDEGNNVEALNSDKNLALSALLQTLMPNNSTTTVPLMKDEDTSFDQTKFNDSWSERDTTWDHLSPASPTEFDKPVFTSPFDVPVVQDNDMRYTKKDVDHRNLISLTETAGSTWGPDDTDYRSLPAPVPSQDNVENVDMEMSDEDDKVVENLRTDEGRQLETINTTVIPKEAPLHDVKSVSQYFNNRESRMPVVETVPLNNGGRVVESKIMTPDVYSPRFSMKNSILNDVEDGFHSSVTMTPPPPIPPSPLPPPPPVPPVWGGNFPRVPPPLPSYDKPQAFPPPPPPPPPPPQHHHQQPPPHQFYGRPPPPKWYPPQGTPRQFRPNYRHFHRGGPRFERW